MLPRFLTAGLFLCLMLGSAAHGFAPQKALFELSAKDLDDDAGPIALSAPWQFHAGDDPAFATAGFDDGDWQAVDSRLRTGERPEDWAGFGWFRLRFWVSPGLRGTPLAMMMDSMGAAEIYLDGAALYSLGTVSPDPREVVPRGQR